VVSREKLKEVLVDGMLLSPSIYKDNTRIERNKIQEEQRQNTTLHECTLHDYIDNMVGCTWRERE